MKFGRIIDGRLCVVKQLSKVSIFVFLLSSITVFFTTAQDNPFAVKAGVLNNDGVVVDSFSAEVEQAEQTQAELLIYTRLKTIYEAVKKVWDPHKNTISRVTGTKKIGFGMAEKEVEVKEVAGVEFIFNTEAALVTELKNLANARVQFQNTAAMIIPKLAWSDRIYKLLTAAVEYFQPGGSVFSAKNQPVYFSWLSDTYVQNGKPVTVTHETPVVRRKINVQKSKFYLIGNETYNVVAVKASRTNYANKFLKRTKAE